MKRERKEKNSTPGQNRRVFLLSSILFFIFMVSVSFFRDKGFIRVMTTETELKDIKERIRLISLENNRYSKEVTALKTHQKRYVERVAREELGLIRNGETVYEFINEDRFWKRKQ